MQAATLRTRRFVSLPLIAVLLTVALASSQVHFSPAPTSILPDQHAGLAGLPLAFEPNTGQTADQSVRFMARALGGTLAFTPSGVALDLPSAKCASQQESCSQTVQMSFLGSEPSARLESSAQLPGKINYLLGNDPAKWHTNLPTYANINYRNLYPGIDLKYEGVAGRLKGTYTLAPGAEPSRIRWSYASAQSVAVDSEGTLQITLPANSKLKTQNSKLSELAPVAWQEIGGKRIPVSASYVVGVGGAISIALGSYDTSHALIIDPTLDFSTYLGGGDDDIGYAITTGPAGVYITGDTQSTNFPVVNAYQAQDPIGDDAFVTLLAPDGQSAIFSTYLGGNGNDEGQGIAVDASGNVYVTGYTGATNFPTTAGAFQTTARGAIDGFITKLNPSGSALVYSTYLGDTSTEESAAIAVDTDGSAYVTGFTTSANFPTLNPYQPTIHSVQDAFVTKLNALGSALVYSTFLGGSVGLGGNYENGFGIAVHSGEAYVTGLTGSIDFPTSNPIQATSGGEFDVFVSHFSASGTQLIYSTYLGGSSGDEGHAIAVDSQGKAYIAGLAYSPNFPTTASYQPTQGGNGDAFVAQINAAGSALIYSTYLGGSSYDYGYGIALDTSGNAYVTGTTGSSNFPKVDPVQTILRGPQDVFVTKLNAAGSALVYSTFIGGESYEHSFAIATDAQGNAFVTGDTYSTTFPLVNPYQQLPGDRIDAFVLKISAEGGGTATVTPTTPPVPTDTQVATNTATSLPPSPTSTRTATPVQATSTHAASTSTPAVSATSVASAQPTQTGVPPTATQIAATETPAEVATETATEQPVTATATACSITFTDVPANSTFYSFIRCLACRGIVSGYDDGTFRPGNDITRGQIAKIVSNAAGFEDDVFGRQTYADVPDSNTFWLWVERLSAHAVMGGYDCGGLGELCDEDNRPYFRPFANATRGQLAKIVSNAAGYSDTPGEQIFTDVPSENTFYVWIQRLASRGIMGGYTCGEPGEPCDSENRPYFRPFNNVTRGQASKIVANTFYPDCQTPTRP